MNPLPAASDVTESVPDADGARSVQARIARGPPSQRTFSTCDSQKLIDLRGLVGLIDVARSPGGSGPVIRIAGTSSLGHAIYKKAPRELPGLIDVARFRRGSGSVIQQPQLPPPRWSLRDSLSDPLFEIFAVYTHFPLIGEVLVFNGMATQIICQSKSVDAFNSSKAQWELKHPRSKHVFRMELPPTGPSRYISAESGVLLQVKIDPTENEPVEVSNKLVDWFNSPMSDKCKSVTIQTRKGKVDVLCAVINDAVEVTLSVWLCIPCELCSNSIHGSITAHTDIFHRDITIFTRGANSGVNPLQRVAHPVPPFLCDESHRHVCLPLVRPFLAVPIQATRLEFKGSLTIGKSKTLSIKETVLLNAEDISSQWFKHEDEDCYTRLSLSIRWAR